MERRYEWTIGTIILTLVALFWHSGSVLGAQNVFAELRADNEQEVADEIAQKVVEKLPDDIHFRLLAIGPIEGDEGSLSDALTARIKSETEYHLIERKDLDKILEEQGIQLSPISDPRRPIEPGISGFPDPRAWTIFGF